MIQIKKNLETLKNEPDYSLWAECLKNTLHNPPSIINGFRKVFDYVTQKEIEIPCDPHLSLRQQIEKYFKLAKKNKIKNTELFVQFDHCQKDSTKWKNLSLDVEKLKDSKAFDFEQMASLEKELNIRPQTNQQTHQQNKTTTVGKAFTSQDGYEIRIGKTREENLKLTFKFAKGNDIWLHVKGKPGAHGLICLPPGKSAPLETLLDACHLVIYYSGGKDWGKTEVDYTYKKHVKRIKTSFEVTYSQNKTLLVTLDQARLKRLLSHS